MYKLLHIPSGVYCEKCVILNNTLYIFDYKSMNDNYAKYEYMYNYLWLDLDSNKWYDLILATLKSINPLTINFITWNYNLNSLETLFDIDIYEFELIKDD